MLYVTEVPLRAVVKVADSCSPCLYYHIPIPKFIRTEKISKILLKFTTGGSAAALLSAAASQRASCPVHSHSPVGSMSGPPNVGGPMGPSGPVGTTACGVPGSSCGPMGPVNMSGPVGSPCGGLCGPGPCHPTPGGSPCGMPGPPGHMPPGMNAMGPGDPMFGPGPNKIPPGDPFYSSPFSPYYRRHTPYMASPEYRCSIS